MRMPCYGSAMRWPIAFVSISFLALASACGDDDGGGASSEDTTGSTDESSSSLSVGESESSSITVGEESSTGVDGGSTDESGSGTDTGSESSSDSGSSGESSGSESGGGSTFACGDAIECELATEYCQRQISDVVGMPDTYQCVPLPEACEGEGTCECLADEFCGEQCEEAPGGGATLSCPGG
jgi:hypothetical protein